jgi:hypothetical protein
VKNTKLEVDGLHTSKKLKEVIKKTLEKCDKKRICA